MQWRNFVVKSKGNQVNFLSWFTYKVGGVRPPTPKSGDGFGSRPPKITPMVTYMIRSNLSTTLFSILRHT